MGKLVMQMLMLSNMSSCLNTSVTLREIMLMMTLSLPPQRLGLPRHLLVPGSREESTTEMDEEEQEETEREEEEDEEDLELTFLCNPQVLQLKEEVEEGRRRLKECKVYFHKYFST